METETDRLGASGGRAGGLASALRSALGWAEVGFVIFDTTDILTPKKSSRTPLSGAVIFYSAAASFFKTAKVLTRAILFLIKCNAIGAIRERGSDILSPQAIL